MKTKKVTFFKKNSWLIPSLIIILSAIISTLPFILRYYYAKDNNFEYFWNFFSVTDINSYLGKMLQAQSNNNWLIVNRYTTENHNPIAVFLFWQLLGKIAAIFKLSLPIMFQLIRILSGIFFLRVFYIFTGYFFKKINFRLAALLLIIFSTGISGLFYKIWFADSSRDALPPDFWGIDYQPIWRFFLHPHLAIGLGLTLISLMLFLKLQKEKINILIFYVTIINLIVAILSPHFLILLGTILFIWLIMNKEYKKLWVLLTAMLPAIGYLGYLYFATIHNTGWFILYWQKYCNGLSIWKSLMGHGVLWILTIYFFINYKRLNLKQYIDHINLILVMLGIIFIMGFFVPLDFSNRFLEFITVPLAIFGSISLIVLYQKINTNILSKLGFYIIVTILFVNNITVLTNFLTIKEEEKEYLFIDQDTVQAIEILDQKNINKKYNILSSMAKGNILPVLSPRLSSFNGHIIETVDDKNKVEFMKKFYRNEIEPEEAEKILEKYNVQYILYSPTEKKLYPGFNVSKYDFLEIIIDNNQTKIFKIK